MAAHRKLDRHRACLEGVLHTGSFTTFKQARAYLVDCWAGLRIERPSIQINCGGAIYDKRESRKRVRFNHIASVIVNANHRIV
jgi:hypothetical protein